MNRRVIVFGLDGVSTSLLRRLVAEGVMPHMGALLAQGDLAAMDTVYPPLSSVSWTTFFTGVNPGRHRIFGFAETQLDAHGLWFQNLNDVKVPALWDYAQAHGKRTISINLPGTYPAPPFNGVMISGFIAEEFSRSVYPKALLPIAQQMGYMLDVDCRNPQGEPEAFWNECRRSLAARQQLAGALLEHEPFDLFISVLTETDRVQHFFYDALEDPWHPQRQPCYDFYRQVDTLIGHWVSLCRPEDQLVILADHGFCRLEQDVYVNHWLQENGYLVMKNRTAGAPLAEFDPERSRAFALDPGRIFLNVKNRQPNGCVQPEDMANLRDEIAAGIASLAIKVPWSPHPFQPIQSVFRREEIYAGPWIGLAADLILHPRDGFDLKAGINAPSISEMGRMTGTHTFGDAVLYVRGAEWNTRDPQIVDVAPTLLSMLGLPVPKELEGRVIVR